MFRLRSHVNISLVAVALTGLTVAATMNRSPNMRTRLQGRWHGTLGARQDSTIVVIDVYTLARGRWIAEADIPSQDVRDFPLSIDLSGDTVRFQLSRSGREGPVLRVVLSRRGDALIGTFAQEGSETPARLSRIGRPDISDELRSMSGDPSGKHGLTVLSGDSRELRESFNAHADRVRLVMLLSPT